MRFGPVPIYQAQGAVLAHSISVGKGRIRKGQLLGPEQIEALENAGIKSVVVAQIEAGDSHEDTAAQALAQSLVPDPQEAGIVLSAAFTGRVNVTAAWAGVVVLDEAKIRAVNRVDPMITLATVPAHQQMTKGGMVATVKIISYGVETENLRRACAICEAAIRVQPVVIKTSSLIISEIPGGAADKGKEAIEGRLRALGVELVETVLVPHQEEAIAAAILAAQGEMILILTGSATSDPYDVAPQALRQAGGQVERFGMPVDPGNLLFLGDIKGHPVIGLPGCARSPALNGADWVLARVACGITVTSDDIADMAVGGLLKEIPTRPMPRRGNGTAG